MKIKRNIAIIDDDKELCNLLKKCMESEGYSVTTRQDGKSGLDLLMESSFDLVILDVMLPVMNGLAVLEKIRKSSNIPVLMLTAKDQELDKVYGLRLGADDYMVKPFSLSELTARVESVLRRYYSLGGKADGVTEKEILDFGKLKIDNLKKTAVKNGEEISLTAKEFELLSFLSAYPEQVFSKRQIYQKVWKEEYVYDDNTIMALIRRLRKKIEDDTENPGYIQTVWGLGYRFHTKG